MKKQLLIIISLFPFLGIFGQILEPESGVLYNIVQSGTEKVVSTNLSKNGRWQNPTLVDKGTSDPLEEAFFFEEVSSNPGAYYIRNAKGWYLTAEASYDTKYESFAVKGVKSQWIIVEDNATYAIRFLHAEKETTYLGSDNKENEPWYLYYTKSADWDKGLFYLQETTVPFTILGKTTEPVIEVEKDVDFDYLFRVAACGQSYDIDVTATSGLQLSVSKLTPNDFKAANGTLEIGVSAVSSEAGTSGKIEFSYFDGGENKVLDNVDVRVVDKYKRYTIVHKASDLFLGNNTESGKELYVSIVNPIVDQGKESQYFMLRQVNSEANDNLYYIMQDVTYRKVAKAETSPWDVEFREFSAEAKWKVSLSADNEYYTIQSPIYESTDKYLGTNTTASNQMVYADKGLSGNCQWLLKEVEVIPVGVNSDDISILNVFGAGNVIIIKGAVIGETVKVYNINGLLVDCFKIDTIDTSVSYEKGIYIVNVGGAAFKVLLD